MTLAQAIRRPLEAIPAAGTARMIVRWDGETGWAQLAVAVPGTGRARFVGFHRFTGGSPDTVVAELATAGCVTASTPRSDDDLMELEAVLPLRKAATDAAR